VTADPTSPVSAPAAADPPAPTTRRGLARIWFLFQLWRASRTDPSAPFARQLAADAAADFDRRYGPLAGQVVLDLGCGRGAYSAAIRDRGADVFPLDYDIGQLHLSGAVPQGALVGDATRLPFPDEAADGVFTSNLLEHVPTPTAVIDEIARVLKPGGWGYISWTNWYSPWGGHSMTPYQFLGPRRGPRLYERLHGPPEKNRMNEGLFATHIGPMLRYVRAHPGLAIEGIEPRYWPGLRFLVHLPVVREVLTWNCVIRVVKRA
jgi:SAM-dependent methyltransferase